MTFAELRQALDRFGLTERATLGQIRDRYRVLVKSLHPDCAGGSDDDRIREITAAYRVLREYCDNYAFSFSREEFFNQVPEERLRMQFGADPWGSG